MSGDPGLVLDGGVYATCYTCARALGLEPELAALGGAGLVLLGRFLVPRLADLARRLVARPTVEAQLAEVERRQAEADRRFTDDYTDPFKRP